MIQRGKKNLNGQNLSDLWDTTAESSKCATGISEDRERLAEKQILEEMVAYNFSKLFLKNHSLKEAQ